jgi:hypothetical protein
LIVIKPGSEIDPAERPGLRFYESTWVNPGQPGSTRKFTHFSFFLKAVDNSFNTKVIFPHLYNLPFLAKWLQKAKATGNAPHYNLIYFLSTKNFEGKTHKA